MIEILHRDEILEKEIKEINKEIFSKINDIVRTFLNKNLLIFPISRQMQRQADLGEKQKADFEKEIQSLQEQLSLVDFGRALL